MATAVYDRLSPAADQVVISYNPRAGKRSRRAAVDELAALLVTRSYSVEVFDDRDLAAQRSQALHDDDRLRALVCAGGDGTVADMVNRVTPGLPLCVLPLGTENLLAKHYGLCGGPVIVADALDRGRVVYLDAGIANGRTFLLMISVGLDAEIIRRLDAYRQGNITHTSYVRPAYDACRSYEYPPLRVTYVNGADGVPGSSSAAEPTQHATTRWIQAINVPRYALGLRFAPQASAADGLLQICAFPRGGFWTTLGYYLSVLFRRQHQWTNCRWWTATRLRIEADIAVPYQLDGDPGGWLPVEVEVVPRRVALVVPGTPA